MHPRRRNNRNNTNFDLHAAPSTHLRHLQFAMDGDRLHRALLPVARHRCLSGKRETGHPALYLPLLRIPKNRNNPPFAIVSIKKVGFRRLFCICTHQFPNSYKLCRQPRQSLRTPAIRLFSAVRRRASGARNAMPSAPKKAVPFGTAVMLF